MTYRCLVTGLNGDGRSTCIRESEIAESVGWMYHFWATTTPPAGPGGSANGFPVLNDDLEPSKGNSIFRIFHIIPDSSIAALDREDFETIAAKIGLSTLPEAEDGRFWHRTDTLDYVVILQGSPILHLEDCEIELKPMDIVVQRGTMHAWSNPHPQTAIAGCVLIGDEPCVHRSGAARNHVVGPAL